MVKHVLLSIVAVALVVLGLIVIWKLVLPLLGAVIGDVFGGALLSLGSFVSGLL